MVDLQIQIAELIETLRSEDPEVQERATTDLARIGQPAILLLLKAIDATHRFGMTIRPFPKPEELELDLQDESQEEAAPLYLNYLNYFSDAATASKINKEYLSRIQQVLVRRGKPAWDEMLQSVQNPPSVDTLVAAERTMTAFTTISVEDLLPALQHSQVIIRNRAASMLATHDDPRVIPALITMMSQSNSSQFLKIDYESMRASAARALASIGAAGVQVLIDALHNDASHVRMAATMGLVRIKDERAFEGLVEFLQSPDRNTVRFGLSCFENLVKSLSSSKYQQLITLLVNFIKTPRVNMAYVGDAGRILANIGEAAVEPLFNVLNDGDESSYGRYEAMMSLSSIYDRNPQITHMRERLMTSTLALVKEHDDLDKAYPVAYALNNVGDQRALPYLHDLLKRVRELPADEEGAYEEMCEDIERAIETIQQRLKQY